MCDKASFAKLRDAQARNAKQIAELQKTDAVQSEQIKTLFKTTEAQGANQLKLVNRLVMAIMMVFVVVVFVLVFAVAYGALGDKGFSAVRGATENAVQIATPIK